MTKIMTWAIGFVAIAALFLGSVGLVGDNQPLPIGGSTSDNWSVGGNLTVTGSSDVEEFTQGGGVATLVDANGGTYTLTATELANNSYLKFASGGTGQQVIALTFPASSTLSAIIPNPGDSRMWIYDSSELVAATTTTITAGTGINIIGVTTNDDVIDGAEYAQITCWREPTTNILCLTSELLNAD